MCSNIKHLRGAPAHESEIADMWGAQFLSNCNAPQYPWVAVIAVDDGNLLPPLPVAL